MTWVAVAVGGASLLGGILGSNSSKKAASQQAQAAQQAAMLQQQQYQQTREDLSPYTKTGAAALNQLRSLMGLSGPQQAIPGMPQPTRDQFTRQQLKYQTIPGSNYDQPIESRQRLVPSNIFDQAGYDQAMARYNESFSQPQQMGGELGALLQPFSLDKFQQSPAYQFNLEQGMDAINKATRRRGTYYAPATLQDIGKYSQGLASNEFLNAYNMYNQDQGNIYSRLMGVSQLGENAAAQTGAFGNQAAQAGGGYMTDAGSALAAGTMGQANAWSGALSGMGDAFDIWQQNRALTSPSYVPQGVGANPASDAQMREMLGPWY